MSQAGHHLKASIFDELGMRLLNTVWTLELVIYPALILAPILALVFPPDFTGTISAAIRSRERFMAILDNAPCGIKSLNLWGYPCWKSQNEVSEDVKMSAMLKNFFGFR